MARKRRRLSFYGVLGESRSFYRPRHAAPSLVYRVAHRISGALAMTPRQGYYYAAARHRRRPAALQPQWPRLCVAGDSYVALPRQLSPYPALAASPARFSAGPGRVAAWHG